MFRSHEQTLRSIPAFDFENARPDDEETSISQPSSVNVKYAPLPYLQHDCPARRRILIGCLLCIIVFTSGCSTSAKDPELRILFLGNSYTFVNNLPRALTELARSGGHEIGTEMSAVGGWTLAQHAQSQETLQRINGAKFDLVVLQEQSQIPADVQSRTAVMFPAVRTLVQQIRSAGAKPVLFATWTHRDGWPEKHIYGYESMQTEITAGYQEIAHELGVAVVPVGEAWRRAASGLAAEQLWQSDGSHPVEGGTYLAACVFYASLFHESPEGLSYQGALSDDLARTLQSVARQVVLSDSSR